MVDPTMADDGAPTDALTAGGSKTTTISRGSAVTMNCRGGDAVSSAAQYAVTVCAPGINWAGIGLAISPSTTTPASSDTTSQITGVSISGPFSVPITARNVTNVGSGAGSGKTTSTRWP